MRKAAAVLISGLSVAGCGSAFAKTETVTGQVIDLYCYSRNNKDVGMDHRDGRECAWACIKWEGQPVGLLTADGKVYQIVGALAASNNARIVPHLSHTVTVTGDVTEKDGMLMIAAKDVTMTK